MLTLRPLKKAAVPCAWATENAAIESGTTATAASAARRAKVPCMSVLLAHSSPPSLVRAAFQSKNTVKVKNTVIRSRIRQRPIQAPLGEVPATLPGLREGLKTGGVLELIQPVESHFLDHAV